MRRILRKEEGEHFSEYPLSHGVETETLVFVAGMAFDYDTKSRLKEAETVEQETKICLDEIGQLLAQAGCTFKDVVKSNVYLAEREYYDAMNRAYRPYWEPGDYPLRCTFYVGIGGDCRVEIDMIAVKPSLGT